jgi:cell division protein FtsL
MARKILIYFMLITIPLSLGAAIYQSNRYASLRKAVERLAAAQDAALEENKRLEAQIALLASSQRIKEIALHDLGLELKQPEEITQIIIQNNF